MEIDMKNKNDVQDNKKVAGIITVKEFIEQKSKDLLKSYYSDRNIQEAKDILQQYSKPTQEEFTFTVGDVNAYLG